MARLGWQDRDQLRPLPPDADDWVELRQLTRIDEDLTYQATRLTNQLTVALKSYYPQVLTAFADIHRTVALTFLVTWPDPREARKISQRDLRIWLRQHRYPGAATQAARIWNTLQQRSLEAPVNDNFKMALVHFW